jgi:tripartite-type tricarboxylate transporter receptor subunit TctC
MKHLEPVWRAKLAAGTAVALGATLLGLSAAGAAPAAYPGGHPVRIVVPYSPGGTTDYAARQMAQQLTAATRDSFVVDNKAGASGQIGTMNVIRAAPDGHTLLTMDTTYTMLPALYPDLPWDTAKDLIPISNIADTPVVIVVNSNAPYKSLKDLVEAARSRPGVITYGSGGVGSATDLAMVLFEQQAQIKLTHIPYKGAGEAMLGVLADNVQVVISAAPTVIPQIRSGKLRPLAVSSERRLKALAQVPTFVESGYPEYKITHWFGFAAPRGTPDAIVQALQTWMQAATRNPEFRQNLEAQGATAGGLSAVDFQARIKSDIDLWTRISNAAYHDKKQ